MLSPAGDVPGLRRRFVWQVVLPIGAVALAATLIATAGLLWTTRESDAVAIERQVETTRRAIAASIDDLAYEEQSDAQWDPLVRELDKDHPDPAWLDENVGTWLNQMFGHDAVYILDPNDGPVYANVDGVRAPATDFEKLRPVLAPLIDGVRGRAVLKDARHSRTNTSFPPSDATIRTRPDAIHVSDITEIAGRPAAASVMKVASIALDAVQRPDQGFLLVVVRNLDATYLRMVARRRMIDGLRYASTNDAHADESIVPILDGRGARHGFLIWRPDLPGTKIWHHLAPITFASVAALILALVLLARWLWGSAQALDTTLVELRASEAQAQHLAFHDVLTALPNRALFDDRLEQALGRARRGEKIAVLTLDLDRFKQVNDTLGHHAGDRLIKEFATRLSGCIRTMDTVARIGGDEFTILLCDVARDDDIERVCNRIFEEIHRPFDLGGTPVFVGISIGIAKAPNATTDRGELMRKADIALYRAKADGRNCRRYFTIAMDESVKRRRQVEEDLRAALANGSELHVHYQPEMSAYGRDIIGLEALVRWDHPTRGVIAPDQFIPVAEETGLICELGEWVLGEAARVALRWPDLFMAVNLSPVQFRSSGFANRAITIVRNAGCDPSQIEIEVTESVLIEDNEQCRTELARLREAGFRIALDDFGTGYSSLSYLRTFQVDKIKIDRSFTQNIGQTLDATAIVTAVVTLGHAMGLTVTAEGVETQDQMRFLSAAGCNELQGFLFSKAMSEEAINALIEGHQTLPDIAESAA